MILLNQCYMFPFFYNLVKVSVHRFMPVEILPCKTSALEWCCVRVWVCVRVCVPACACLVKHFTVSVYQRMRWRCLRNRDGGGGVCMFTFPRNVKIESINMGGAGSGAQKLEHFGGGGVWGPEARAFWGRGAGSGAQKLEHFGGGGRGLGPRS